MWLVIQPLVMTGIFSGVFGAVGGFSTDGVPRPLFYLAGLVPWAYFSQVFGQVAGSLHGNVQLFSKVYFPRLVIPLSVVLSGLVGLLIQLACFLVVMVIYVAIAAECPVGNWTSLFALPSALLLLMVLTLGAGLWMAVLTARYRDLAQVAPFIVQVLMYVTPLIYPLSSVPERYRLLASLNPLTVVLETFRSCSFGTSAPGIGPVLVAVVSSLVVLVSGFAAFSRVEKNIVDSI
jgi:lipopolysaccharide transport system permease protein